ncbi:MAG: cysteine hydrolase [Anaerolineales bacterium]|nr:cysteine hydrolase [Anaerolineales bacterium]
MATIREGDKKGLLVVDVQAGVMQYAWEPERIIRNINLVVDKARSRGVPIIWVQHTDEDLVQGSPEWQLASGLSPTDGEARIEKRYNSSFEDTPLEEILSRLGVSHIVLTGAATNWCIRATACAALDRGYDLTLVSDAHTTETMEFKDGVRIEASDIIRELNNALEWLSYPGRKNNTISAKNLDL